MRKNCNYKKKIPFRKLALEFGIDNENILIGKMV